VRKAIDLAGVDEKLKAERRVVAARAAKKRVRDAVAGVDGGSDASGEDDDMSSCSDSSAEGERRDRRAARGEVDALGGDADEDAHAVDAHAVDALESPFYDGGPGLDWHAYAASSGLEQGGPVAEG
jgi:hypothetical protein